MLRTVSVARVMALVETRSGCTTFSSRMLVMAPFLTFIPAAFSPYDKRKDKSNEIIQAATEKF
jgi:hypothetical protein